MPEGYGMDVVDADYAKHPRHIRYLGGGLFSPIKELDRP